MKLELALGFAALLMIGTGCAAQPAPQVEAPKAPVVSTTKLMAAELTEASDAPKVSKPQHSVDSEEAVDTNVDKDLPTRKSEHRHGGGFSGYK